MEIVVVAVRGIIRGVVQGVIFFAGVMIEVRGVGVVFSGEFILVVQCVVV